MSLVEWGVNLIIDWIANYGYLAIILLMALESACMPVPSEIVMPFAGYLVYQSALPGYDGVAMTLLGITVAGAVGCSIGSVVAYAVGYRMGRPFIAKYGKYVLIREKHMVTAEKWFAKYGDAATFVSRLLPIIRTVISLPAGIAKMRFPRFLMYSFVGSVPWTLLLGYIGYSLGPSWRDFEGVFRQLDIVVVGAVVAIIVWYAYRVRKNGRAAEGSAQL